MGRHVFLWTVCWSCTKQTLYFNQWKQIKLTKEKPNRHRRRMDTEKQNQASKNRTKQTTVFSGLRVTRSIVLHVCFCRLLFVLLYFFLCPLCCLFFFDIRILITSLWYLQTLLKNRSRRHGSCLRRPN